MTDNQIFTRPRSIPDMLERMKNFSTDAGWQRGLDFKPDPTDVFIVTPPKCGTTWMQQIVHGLRTRGSMDFEEISSVVPWINMAHDMGIDIHAPQVANPRAFKTHSTLDEVPKGAKYIVILRNPHDALVSNYYFFDGFFFEKGSIDIETFAREFYIPRRAVCQHITALWDRRSDENILPLCYENMKTDLAGTIEKVAHFIGIPLDDELRQIVLRQSNIKFMQEHKAQFEDHLIRKARSASMRLPLEGQLNKVRNGEVGESKDHVSDEIRNELVEVWRKEITAKIGLNSYEDLRQELMM
ncbi:MAG TPA: sulfotransferase domain-containing protein [Anaerolineales bacterium]|nr:sulfotransferase domain-containing protein [Anaerolineales bacterium]